MDLGILEARFSLSDSRYIFSICPFQKLYETETSKYETNEIHEVQASVVTANRDGEH
jgi:hypothetical protein